MLASQFKSSSGKRAGMEEHFCFFYKLADNLDICLDGKTYGNDARFCRRSHDWNAELKHVIDKGKEGKSRKINLTDLSFAGSLHLFIVSAKPIAKNQEIILPSNRLNDPGLDLSPLPSINADLKEIKKTNGILSEDKESKRVRNKGPNKKQHIRPKKRMLAKKVSNNDEDYEEPEDDNSVSEPEVNGDGEDSSNEASNTNPNSPSKAKPSPGKMGLPDNSGLIVGVNTINYDASSALRNKAKSREERKMEMIMKAIEQMEKAEQRKKEQSTSGVSDYQERGSAGAKRRKSTAGSGKSINSEGGNEASSPVRKKGKAKGSTPGTPQRRRSRVHSGGSSMSAGVSESEANPESANSVGSSGPFRFPKTKKSMMSDWFQESEISIDPEDDDVSGSYLKGSRSPPGIATHLLRAAPHSPVKNVTSAKKRWLRQAISEDHTEDANSGSAAVVTNGGSPTENNMDYVTPLKKRRLANFKGQQEQNEGEKEENNFVPNSLKKKLLHNIVLEAVLDKAMEDMLGDGNAPSPSNKENKNDVEVKDEKVNVEEVKQEEMDDEVESESKVAPVATSSDDVSANPDQDASKSSIKTPEPSSVFKSFFKSNVSIEQLEAEIEATKKQREFSTDGSSPMVTTFTSATSEALVKDEKLDFAKLETHGSSLLENKLLPPMEDVKPKEKRRVSMADYKRRRKQDGPASASSASTLSSTIISSAPLTVPPTAQEPSPKPSTVVNHSSQEGPGTPTMDEPPVDLGPPTLNTLPYFEKLEQLEQAHKENNKRIGKTKDELVAIKTQSDSCLVFVFSSGYHCLARGRAKASRLDRAAEEGVWPHRRRR